MLINKQCKNAIVKPSEDYMNRMATYLTYRTRTLEGFKEQLSPQSFRKVATLQSVFSSKPMDQKFEINVQSQMKALSKVSLSIVIETKNLKTPTKLYLYKILKRVQVPSRKFSRSCLRSSTSTS